MWPSINPSSSIPLGFQRPYYDRESLKLADLFPFLRPACHSKEKGFQYLALQSLQGFLLPFLFFSYFVLTFSTSCCLFFSLSSYVLFPQRCTLYKRYEQGLFPFFLGLLVYSLALELLVESVRCLFGLEQKWHPGGRGAFMLSFQRAGQSSVACQLFCSFVGHLD